MKKYFPLFVLTGCAAIFALGLMQLFELRFKAGDVYPPYSSLRSDPLGTMAFYESLGKLPGLTARRDFSPANRLPEEPATAYLHLAASPDDWDWVPVDLDQEIKAFLGRGGRLVIAFNPETVAPRNYDAYDEDATNSVGSEREKTSSEKLDHKQSAKHKKMRLEDESWVYLAEAWGFHPGFMKLPDDGDHYAPVRVTNESALPLPPSLNWHSGMIFTNSDPAWQTVYARGTNAVVMERKFGRGSVVLASDCYFLSNEAMEKDRQPPVLAWLVGPARNVVFDEGHLGILDTSGVATLMRQYRLEGLAAALLLLAGLFIWQNSTSLVPPRADEKSDDFVTGKDAASGFVNLLRRSIKPGDLLATCFAEWQKSHAGTGAVLPGRFRQAEAIFQAENAAPARDRNPVAAYHKIAAALGNQKEKS